MKIVTTNSDGGVWITTLVDGHKFEDVMKKWPPEMQEKYVSHREMPDDAIPKDRTNREAWEDKTAPLVIDVNMEKRPKLTN